MVTESQQNQYRSSISAALQAQHRQQARNLVIAAAMDGVFPDAFPPFVFPLAVDANVLRDEILYMDRREMPTILVSAASSGGLRLYCAQHVVDEVEKHLARWAREKSVDPRLAHEWWQKTHRRLLRVVDVPTGEDLYTPAEAERLHDLAERDKDDLPTAKLALLLGAPVLTKDKDVLPAVYEGIDYQQHVAWFGAVAAGGDLVVYGGMGQASVMVTVGGGQAAIHGVRVLVDTVPWPVLLLAAAAALLAYRYMVPGETKQRITNSVKDGTRDALTLLGSIAMEAVDAKEKFDQLAAPSCDLQELVRVRGVDAALTRGCMYQLARQRQSHVSAAELQALLDSLTGSTNGEQEVRATLRTQACFTEVYQGRFQLGRSLA